MAAETRERIRDYLSQLTDRQREIVELFYFLGLTHEQVAERLGLAPFGAALAVWFGTPLLFYMYVAPPFSHACSAFAVALFMWTWLKVRASWSIQGAFALGAAGALMAMIREQDLFFVAGPAADFVLTGFRLQASGFRLAAGAAGVLGFAAAYIPQAIVYVRLNGHLGPSRLVTRKMSWHAPHALQVMFSPEHGYFVWTPLALIAIAGLVWLAVATNQSDRRVAGCMLLVIALQVYVGGSVESWTVAGAFGQRRFIALTAFLVIGLAALMQGRAGLDVALPRYSSSLSMSRPAAACGMN